MEAAQKKNSTLQIGQSMPALDLLDQDGKIWNSIRNLSKGITIVYFYPKNESGICTKEACAFRDSFTHFTDAGAQVIGINSGTVESHKKFAKKNNLPFKLLSDTQNRVLKQFGVKKTLFMTGRETFIFNGDGILVFKFRSFLKGDAHVEEALQFLGISPV